MTYMERVDHIDRLLREHHIHVESRAEVLAQADKGMLPMHTHLTVVKHTTGIMPSYSCLEDNTIFLNDQDYGEEIAYFVALHEIGHLLTKKESLKWLKVEAGFIVTPHDEVQSERIAWDWAIHNAIEITPTMDAWREHAFGTYTKYEKKYQEWINGRKDETVRGKGRGSHVSAFITKARALLSGQVKRSR